jgi:PAS domain S-box-containing protein
MSLQALISPVVAVLLILAGVVLSVLLTGTGKQNEAEAVRSQQLIESGFHSIGRDIGRLTKLLARSEDVVTNLSAGLDPAWAEQRFASLASGYGPVETVIMDSAGNVVYTQAPATAAESSASLRQFVEDARAAQGSDMGWKSAFVTYHDQLHLASASVVDGASAEADDMVLILLHEVDEALLSRISDEFLVDDIMVHPATNIHGSVGFVIRSPQGEDLGAITWSPARPGDKLFEYLLGPIVIASLIAALLLATFLRTAVRAAQQLKRGAEALAESGEALEYSESMLSAIIHGVADGIVTIDESGKITSANASMNRIFGYDAEEILGEDADMLLAGNKVADKAGKTLIAASNVGETEYREFTGRRKDGGRFVLDAAISHITYQSEAVAIAIMRDITERKQAEETLNLLTTGMALVDRDGRLLLANRSASRLLDSGDGIRLRNGRIVAERRDQIEQLHDLVYSTCSGEGSEEDEGAGVMTIDRGDGVRPLSIKVAPVELNPGDSGSRVAAVFIRDLEIRQTVPPEVVAKLFGLTFAEARVVVELVKGKRPQEVAEDLGVSLNTVRNQLKQIFSKTNTGRQSELISLVLSSAAFVSEHGLEIEDGDDAPMQLTGN